MHLRHNKRGQDHIFTGREMGRDLKIQVSGNGYRVSAKVEIQYEAITERAGAGFQAFIHRAIDEALATAANARHVNVPLFDLPDEAQTITPHEGINQL
jgi:hypothetical protein